jgi:dipeptidyl aminopeptidase/acylaminoacyl peptidase
MTIKTAADLLPQAADSADKIDNSSLTGSSVTVLASDPSLLTKQTSTAETKTSSVDHFNRSLADLAVIDVTTGKVKRLAKRVKPLAYTFSPNGQRVLYTNVRWHEENGRGDVVYSLIVLDLVSGEQHLLAKDALRSYGLTVSWSPDGRRIVYADASGGLIVVGESEPGAALTSWKELHRFTKTGVRFQTDFTTPLWSDDGRRIYISGAGTLWEFRFDGESVRSLNIPDHHLSGIIADNKNGRMWNGNDGKSAYVVTHNRRTQRKGFFRIPLESNESAEQLWQGDVYMGPVWADIDLSANGATFAFVAQEAKHPQELWLSSDGLRNVSRISKLHSGLDRFTLGESRLIEWASTKGVRLKGVLLLPAGYTPGKCYPLIVHVYPDERPASIVYRFGLKEGNAYNQQLLATRGYAVLIPEIPLSKGNPVDDIAAAVLPAVNHVVELGIADPARVGVTGSSAGGYAALALITRSNLFAAAVADQGFGSLFSYYSRLNDNGNSPSVSYIEDYGFNMGGHPWSERLQPYIEQSPYFQLDKIKTPLLLTHGDSDRIVSSQLSKEIFVGLRRLDKPVVLALYRGENHGIGGWRHDNLEDYWNRVWSWWDRWLGVNRKTIGDNSKQAK